MAHFIILRFNKIHPKRVRQPTPSKQVNGDHFHSQNNYLYLKNKDSLPEYINFLTNKSKRSSNNEDRVFTYINIDTI